MMDQHQGGYVPNMDVSMNTGMNNYDANFPPLTSWSGPQYNYHHVMYSPTYPWTGSESYHSAHAPYHTDEEMAYYNNLPHNRCSSVDTIYSTSSQSTVMSQDSMCELDNNNVDPNALELRNTRKRKRVQSEANQPKKVRKARSYFPYKRWPKPPYSYHGLIATVIWNSPNKSLSLQGICDAIAELFPFFQGSYTGWRDSIRNYLSKTPCFVKVETKLCYNLWTVDVSQLKPKMFLRQENRPDSKDYKPTIHEQLDIPPIPGLDYCRTTFVRSKPTRSVMTVPKFSKPSSNSDIQETDDAEMNVALPDVDQCLNHTESPYTTSGYKRQESEHVKDTCSTVDNVSSQVELDTPTSCEYEYLWHESDNVKDGTVTPTPNVTSDIIVLDTPTRPRAETMSNPSDTLNNVRNFVKSESRSSYDAVQLLHSLCFAGTNLSDSVTDPTAATDTISMTDYVSDSDASDSKTPPASPEFAVPPHNTRDGRPEFTVPGEDINSYHSNSKRYTDFSIAGLFSPPSPTHIRIEPFIDISSPSGDVTNL